MNEAWRRCADSECWGSVLMESPDGTGPAVARRGSARVTEGSAWLIGDRPCPPATPCRGRPIGAVRALTLLGASGSRSQIDDTSHAYNICSSIQLLNINATSYDLFCNAVFFAYAQPIDWVGSIMFSGCPSICAYVRTSRRRHFPTG